MFRAVFSIILLCGNAGFAFENTDGSNDFMEMSLEDLMDVEIGVASRNPATQYEAPGVVTIITREQILKSGARDLVDIIRFVPGFNIEYDISGAFGIGVRGLWANEGKVLVLIDGLEMNDDVYGTFQYGHHIPVDIIERIEIMRGPGSVIYGDSAELAVISIETISPTEENEFMVSSTYSRMKGVTGREGITTYYGNKKGDNSISVATFYEQGNFTDRKSSNYDLERGYPISMDMGKDNNSQVKSTFFDVAANFGNLGFRTIIDRYKLNSPWPDSQMYKTRFFSDIFEAKHKLPVTDDLLITSKFVYKHQEPWTYPPTYDAYWDDTYVNEITSNKFTGDFNFSYNIGEENNITAGITFDDLSVRDDDGSGSLEDGKNKVSYFNRAIYAEGHFHTPMGNLTIGGRHVKHNRFGSNFVPRFVLTKTIGDSYVKAIYTEAYRNPDPMNIAYNADIKPEKTKSYELEVGKQLSEHTLLTANIFDVEISDPIVYSNYSYVNFEKTASQGIESTLKYRKNSTDIALSYSFYRVKSNKATEYDIPGHSDELLGMPSHKLSLYASLNPVKDFFVTPSVTYYSHRYAVTNYDGTDYTYKKTNPKMLADISFLFKNAFKTEELDLSLSVHNIFNEKFDFIQPYLGNYGPMPGPSRAFTLKLTYKF